MRFLVDFGAGQREENQSEPQEVPLWKVPFLLLWKALLIIWKITKVFLQLLYYLLVTIFTSLCILLFVALFI